MGLKNLKDLNQGKGIEVDGVVFSDGKVKIEDLREEAIKWINFLKNEKTTMGINIESDMLAQIFWIKRFFNIMEKDLK